ncbi:hypothetical protein CUMW_279620 [Citrus unshiu]|uniref:Uncharacterized protein n=1 Tax=Citrus unshiu TaxID=55188 RepID=A0A2H5N816_CITUN|nr:hypothetical protein CUMW_279620 [Citrus unshiu]
MRSIEVTKVSAESSCSTVKSWNFLQAYWHSKNGGYSNSGRVLKLMCGILTSVRRSGLQNL